MKPSISISKCVYLLATVQLLLANDKVEKGNSKIIARQKYTARYNFRRSPLGNPITPKEKSPPGSSSHTFCGSDIYDQITTTEVKNRMGICCEYIKTCSDFIEPKQTKYGLHNPHEFRILTCECDSMFKSCLDEAEKLYKNPIFEVVEVSYFMKNSRNCLLKLYSHSCEGPWFDDNEYEYDMNLDFYFFCPRLIPSVRRAS